MLGQRVDKKAAWGRVGLRMGQTEKDFLKSWKVCLKASSTTVGARGKENRRTADPKKKEACPQEPRTTVRVLSPRTEKDVEKGPPPPPEGQ